MRSVHRAGWVARVDQLGAPRNPPPRAKADRKQDRKPRQDNPRVWTNRAVCQILRQGGAGSLVFIPGVSPAISTDCGEQHPREREVRAPRTTNADRPANAGQRVRESSMTIIIPIPVRGPDPPGDRDICPRKNASAILSSLAAMTQSPSQPIVLQLVSGAMLAVEADLDRPLAQPVSHLPQEKGYLP